MNLIRYNPESVWSPFNRLATLRDEFDRMLNPVRENGGIFGAWAPPLDVHDEKDNYIVNMEVPGVKKDEISISLHDGVLTISGERKDEREAKEGGVLRTERHYGKFERSLSLPALVDAAKVAATVKDGVLTVTLPKAEEAKPKQIKVSVA